MASYYYKKEKKKNMRVVFRILSLFVCGIGLFMIVYIFFPLISWHFYFAPVFASQDVATPIPKTRLLTSTTVKSLFSNSMNGFNGTDYLNAQNWFPSAQLPGGNTVDISSYLLSIPKLEVKNAEVSTTDSDLSVHLVNYYGTSIPPQKGNAVIFGHSTLPQLFNPSDYKTIFANAYKLTVGDEIIITLPNISYTYRIFNITVVDPDDTSIFSQDYSDSFVTLVTCTPPGTTWKRLIIKAKLQKI